MSHRESSLYQSRIVRLFFGRLTNENVNLKYNVIESVLSLYAVCFNMEARQLLIVRMHKIFFKILTGLLVKSALIVIIWMAMGDYTILFLVLEVLVAVMVGVHTAKCNVIRWCSVGDLNIYDRINAVIGISWQEFRWESLEGGLLCELRISPLFKLESRCRRSFLSSLYFAAITISLGFLCEPFWTQAHSLLFFWFFCSFFFLAHANCYLYCVKVAKEISIPAWKSALVAADRDVQVLANYECFNDS